MKKLYEEPILEVRNYAIPPRDIVMTSDGETGGSNPGTNLDGDDNDPLNPGKSKNYF